MAVRLSTLHASRPLPPERFLVLIGLRKLSNEGLHNWKSLADMRVMKLRKITWVTCVGEIKVI
jgi:hypothetical protein